MLIPARTTPITDVQVYSELPTYRAISREAVSSRTMMHTLAPNTMALQPTSAQKSPARLVVAGFGKFRSPPAGPGVFPRENRFGPRFAGPKGGSFRESI